VASTPSGGRAGESLHELDPRACCTLAVQKVIVGKHTGQKKSRGTLHGKSLEARRLKLFVPVEAALTQHRAGWLVNRKKQNSS